MAKKADKAADDALVRASLRAVPGGDAGQASQADASGGDTRPKSAKERPARPLASEVGVGRAGNGGKSGKSGKSGESSKSGESGKGEKAAKKDKHKGKHGGKDGKGGKGGKGGEVKSPSPASPLLRVVRGTVPPAPAKVPSVRDVLRLHGGAVDLDSADARATPHAPGGKVEALADIAAMEPRLAELQERLYAQAVAGGSRKRLLLVLQGMDTSGKGGVVKHVIGQFNPSGCHIHAFKSPTREELAHPFLWRVRQQVPAPGMIGIFDRSHYEDVLIVRVRDLVSRNVWSRRYATINRFEESLHDDEVTVVKVFLHISHGEQRERLLERLDNPDKHWKFNPGDIDERAMWPAYQEAYEAALQKCTTDIAPWYVVPADRKWYRNWAISRLLLEHLEEIDPQYPQGHFDVEAERKRLLDT